MGITKQEGEKQLLMKRLIDIGLAVLLALIVILAVMIIKKDFNEIGQDVPDVDIPLASEESSVDEGQTLLVSEAIDNEKIYQGPLILVNSTTEYKWDGEGLKSIMEVRDEDGTDCYEVMDHDVSARTAAAVSLNNMIKAFSAETGNEDIRVDSAYRSVDEQQSIYDNADDQTNVSEPGFSDYHTGYSIDLNVVSEDGESLDFDGTGDYEWFIKNCYRYGFVVRCPEGKQALTGQDYRPWHFRYVGKVHAAYMYDKGLCLEEYISMLKSYPYDGAHLETIDPDGNSCEIYYFPADVSTALTSVAVPSDKEYEISGNNSDGFIISFVTGVADVAATEKPSETKATEPATESSDAEEEPDDYEDYEQDYYEE